MDTFFVAGGYFVDSSSNLINRLSSSEAVSLSGPLATCSDIDALLPSGPLTKFSLGKSGGQPVLCGGTDSAGTRQSDCYVYSKAIDEWSPFTASLTYPRDRYSLVQINDQEFWITG